MYSYHRHPQQQQQHSSFVDYSSVQQQSQQKQVPVTMAPIPMATPTLDFSLDESLDQALLDMMNANTSDLLTMNGFESSFSFTPECSLDNTTLDNQNSWALQKEQDWMLTPYNFQQQSSSLFSESLLPLHSSQYQHHSQQQQQHNHHHYYQHFQQQQQQGQQHHQDQQQTQQQHQDHSHIHPLQTLSPLACDALLTNSNTSSSNNSELFFEESTLISPQEMLPMDASLASSPTWSSSPASVASSIEDNKPTTPLDTTFDDELIEPRQLEFVHRSPSPLPTTIFYDDQEDEEDYNQDNQSLLLVQQQQQEQEEVELEEEEQEDDENDNDSDPDWSIGKKPQQHSRRHVRKNSKTSRGTNKSNKKTCTKKLANHNPHKSSSGRSTPDLTNNSDIRCTNCETQNTPLWRRDSAGEPLCNACGLFLKLHGVVRPLSLKTDVIKKRNRSGHSIHKSPRSRKSRREKK